MVQDPTSASFNAIVQEEVQKQASDRAGSVFDSQLPSKITKLPSNRLTYLQRIAFPEAFTSRGIGYLPLTGVVYGRNRERCG